MDPPPLNATLRPNPCDEAIPHETLSSEGWEVGNPFRDHYREEWDARWVQVAASCRRIISMSFFKSEDTLVPPP